MARTGFARGALPVVPLLLGMLFFEPAHADQQPLTLPQVVAHSLKHNGELKALREERGLHEAGKLRAGTLPNPTLDFEAATGALTGSSSENSLALGVSQEFLLAGKRGKRLGVAESDLELYRWQLADRERLLRDEVTRAFQEALLATSRVALADRFITLNRQLLEVTRERLAAGDIPELEMNLALVELARSESARIEALKGSLQSKARLWSLMGLPLGSEGNIAGTLESEVPLAKPLPDLKQLARENRPDLKALQSERRRSDAEITLAQSEATPNLTGGLVLRRDSTSMEIGGVEGKDTAYTVGVKLSIPLPVFDRNRAGIQEATARRSSSESRLAAAQANLDREVEIAYLSYLNSAKVLSLYKADILPQLEENMKLTQEAYRLGEVGILAVIQEQKKFFEVHDGYLNALRDRQSALAQLETVTASEISGGGK